MNKFGLMALVIAAVAMPAGVVLAQSKPAQSKPAQSKPAQKSRQAPAARPKPVDQDQSYLYLAPNSATRAGGPNYVTQGQRESNQPYFNTGAWPDGVQPWSNR